MNAKRGYQTIVRRPLTGADMRRPSRHFANIMTLARLVFIPPVALLLMTPGKGTSALGAALFVIACLTDYLDGLIARYYCLESSLGRFLDPLADKVLVVVSVIVLAQIGRIPHVIMALLIGREIVLSSLYAVRVLSDRWKTPLQISLMAKWKTLVQFSALAALMIHYRYHFIIDIDFHVVGVGLIWISLILSYWSAADYLITSVRDYRSTRPRESEFRS
jgi:CDP-diacylglycerol--glycerol-3-phosphate 3-phosphatidyltransferase